MILLALKLPCQEGREGLEESKEDEELRHVLVFFFQAEDGIRDIGVTGVQTCALPILARRCGADRHGVVGQPDVQRVGVGVRVHRHGLEPQVAAGADDADGDLTAVGDEDPPELLRAHAASTAAMRRPASVTARRTALATSTAFGPSPWMHAEPAVSGTRVPSTASTTPSSRKSRVWCAAKSTSVCSLARWMTSLPSGAYERSG